MRYLCVVALSVCLAVVTACDSSTPVSPIATPSTDAALAITSPAGAVSTTARDDSGRYLFLFRGNRMPSDFSSHVEEAGGTILFQHDSGFAFVSNLADDAAAALGARRDVAAMEADISFELELPDDSPEAHEVESDVVTTGNPEEAFFFALQWNMRAIEADRAWAAGRLGSEEVTVAILDSGIDYLYPDLVGRVDLSRSVSFVPEDDELVDAFFPGREHITDLNWHGTHVAATAVSNGIVAAGVTAEPTLMAVKVCDFVGSCSFGAVLSGILYAADNDADVINMSIGALFSKSEVGGFVGFLHAILNEANRKNATVVVSAGNDALNLDRAGNLYKAFCDSPNAVCVSATGPTASESDEGPFFDVDAPAFYTNFGRSAIDVAAPGGNTGGAIWAACSTTSLVIPFCQTGIFIIGALGTSMAAPHVAGLAALLVEDYGARPGRISSALHQTADKLGQSGNDPFYGKGRINVGNAVGAQTGPAAAQSSRRRR